MLNDTLGIIVAFLTIIFLLSILVTGLVQATQALVGLRGRILFWGIAKLIASQKFEQKKGPVSRAEFKQDVKDPAKKEAASILNKPQIGLLYNIAFPDTLLGKVWRFVRGPGVSWVEPDDLINELFPRQPVSPAPGSKPPGTAEADARSSNGEKTLQGADGKTGKGAGSGPDRERSAGESPQLKDAKKQVSTLEKQVSKRFEGWIRALTLGWGLAVAVAFQVSTPQLFNELASDSARRSMILSETSNILASEKQMLIAASYENGAARAINELSNRYPKLRDKFEGLSGVGTKKEFQIEELLLALKEEPNRDEVARTYSELLDAEARAYADSLGKQIRQTTATLSGLGVQFWHDKIFFGTFLKPNWEAIIGVIVTGILLSFGAPFWFKLLREAAFLRDRLAPKVSGGRETGGGQKRGDKREEADTSET